MLFSNSNTSLACPDRYSSCSVPQNPSNGFCHTCADFCTSCDKSQLPAPPAANQGKAGVSVGAIVGAVVAACAALLGLALILYYCCSNKRQEKGAARGFEYLHSFGIVHRDIKPANILLNGKMLAKISDFGLVRMGEGTALQTTRVVGTPGYVDPAYAASNKATTAADVYSFGVVMLELMTGRAAVQESLAPGADEEPNCPVTIVSWVEQQLQQSNDSPAPSSLKDPRMEARDDLVLAVVRLALRCTARRTAARPDMGTIAAELSAVMAELGGSKRNTAAEEVDRQMEEFEPARSMEEEFARINARFQGSQSDSYARLDLV
ncbi:unnamed protein product [Closterium sp. Yama58-4]|nr:unnamed protein product [Closterium sp. Yama58-4]